MRKEKTEDAKQLIVLMFQLSQILKYIAFGG